MGTIYSIAEMFGESLAELLAGKNYSGLPGFRFEEICFECCNEDEVMFVKKSVANHLTDWLKVNKAAVTPLMVRWSKSENRHTQWILKRATRKISI